MAEPLIDPQLLKTLIGGTSVLDIPRLTITDRNEAVAFLRAYGYDLADDSDVARLWSYHRRAVSYLQTQLLQPEETVPTVLSEEVLLRDPSQLLIYASDKTDATRQRWACAILRIMHVLAHLSNDLFTVFSDEIQQQILKPYQEVISNGQDGDVILGDVNGIDQVVLKKFDVKPFKTSNSSITKLLAKPEEVAFGLLDKMGVRFVTPSIYDCFRVMSLLVRKNIISFPHLIPDQANNTLYPINLFVEVMSELKDANVGPQEMDARLLAKLETSENRAAYREKLNVFTSRDYRFIKFIVRKLIRARVEGMERPLMFFYPYEVQIMDLATHLKNSSGPSSHGQYKQRQKVRARERVFGKDLN